jgi:acetoin utilization protein AcuB
MRIQEIMTTNVHAIGTDATLARARDLMKARGIRHLVVKRDGRLAGIVSERDVGGPRGAAPAGTVADAMSHGVVSISPDATLRDAANLLRGHVIGCLPVTQDDRLVGIVTISDVLDALGRGEAPMRGRTKPYVARRQGPLGKARGERLKPRGRR